MNNKLGRIMKSLFFFAFVLLTIAYSARAATTEERQLAELEVERTGFLLIYSSANPHVRDLDAKINSIKSKSEIQSDLYRDALREILVGLRIERSSLADKYADSNPRIQIIDAKISFVRNQLDKNDG